MTATTTTSLQKKYIVASNLPKTAKTAYQPEQTKTPNKLYYIHQLFAFIDSPSTYDRFRQVYEASSHLSLSGDNKLSIAIASLALGELVGELLSLEEYGDGGRSCACEARDRRLYE